MAYEGVRGRGATAALCAMTVALVGLPAASAAEPSGDPPASMYSPTTVDAIRLELPEASVKALEEDPEGEYVEGEFSLATTGGTPDTVGAYSTPLKVGVRLKGGIGSFRPLSEKAGVKIKFSYVPGQKFLGLKKMTLNNMVQDESMVHEVLAYEAFRASGVPSPRTGFAYLEVNGEDFGLHLNIENTDDVAMKKRFGSFKHVYEGEHGDDVTPGGAGNFEVDEGDEGDLSDLEGLISLVNGTDPADFSTRVQSVADLAEMTRMWAIERYIGHWDGYPSINNYYLFSDAAGVFRMLPWGTDQTWVDHWSFGEEGGTLFRHCRDDPSCEALYRRALIQARAVVNRDGRLDGLAASTAALLLPWQELEEGNARHEYDVGAIGTAVQQTREFIADRGAELGRWLADHPPEPASEASVSLQPDSIAADGISTTEATATVTDQYDNAAPGDQLEFTSSDSQIGFGSVVDHDDGTYTVQITSSTTAGTPTITATDESVDPELSGAAVLTQTAGDASEVELTLQPDAIAADGHSTSSATATVTDEFGNPVPGDQLEFTASDPQVGFGSVTDDEDGTYTVQITSSTMLGTATITATDLSVSGDLGGSAQLFQTVGAPDQMTLGLVPSSIPADGTSETIVQVRVYDAAGRPLLSPQVQIGSSDPGQSIGPLVGDGSGAATARIRSSITPGDATITATETSVLPALSATGTLVQSAVSSKPAAPGEVPVVPATPGDAPAASITGKPRRRTRDHTPTFRFRADAPSPGFRCRIDGRAYRPCDSPMTLGWLGDGDHLFNVFALDANGQPGGADSYRFVIKPPAAARHRRAS
jgi:hypothetical protein